MKHHIFTVGGQGVWGGWLGDPPGCTCGMISPVQIVSGSYQSHDAISSDG